MTFKYRIYNFTTDRETFTNDEELAYVRSFDPDYDVEELGRSVRTSKRF